MDGQIFRLVLDSLSEHPWWLEFGEYLFPSKNDGVAVYNGTITRAAWQCRKLLGFVEKDRGKGVSGKRWGGRPMEEAFRQRIVESVEQARQRFYQLVILTELNDSAGLVGLAQDQSWPILNVGLKLSEGLQELSRKERAFRANGMLQDLIRGCGGTVVVLDHIELLFSPDLQLDPLAVFRSLSRNRCLIVLWPGRRTGGALEYAAFGHPEYRKYEDSTDYVVLEPGA